MRYLLLSMIILSVCAVLVHRDNCDNFYNTRLKFNLEVDSIKINNSGKISLQISSDQQKEVRFYNDFHNIEITTYLNMPLQSHRRRLEPINNANNQNTESNIIESFNIKKKEPFISDFSISTYRKGNIVTLSVDPLRYQTSFAVGEDDNYAELFITGSCNPINACLFEANENFIKEDILRIIL